MWFAIGTVGLALFVTLVGFLITHVPFGSTVISLRYSITGFIIFIGFTLISSKYFPKTNLEHTNLEVWYVKIIKWMLVGSIIWWLIIYFIPRLLEFAGYNKSSYE
jgi:hypothetical protein